MNYKINKDIISSPWSALILIIITAIIIYSNIYNAPFVFDDEQIVETKEIRDLSHYFSFEQILVPRNIVYFTFSINYKLCGLNVIGYHITNVLIHIVNGFLVYFLALIIFGKLNKIATCPDSTLRLSSFYKRSLTCSENSLMSLFTALIFVAHPIQTQAVTYTIQRMASMAAMFYMASVLFYLKARVITQGPKRDSRHSQESKYSLTFYILSGLCGILALLSKQSAASLPGAILLVEYLLINRAWQGWKKTIPWFSFSFMLWVIFVAYVLGLFSSEINSENLSEDIFNVARVEQVTISRWEYLCTQFNVLVIYIRMLFLPVYQCIDYLYPYKEGLLDGYTPIAFLFLLGILSIGIWSIRKRPIISLAVFWFFITLSVESSIIPLYAYFEHRLYLPMFGFSMFVTWSLFHFFPTNTPRRHSWVIVACIVIIMLLGASTYHRNRVWQDEIKLWSDAVSKSPKNCRAHNNLGNAFFRQGRPEESSSHYKEALLIEPGYAIAHNNLGAVLVQQGKHVESILHYKEALRLYPDYDDAHNNLGLALVKQDKYEEAILHYKEALRLKPDHIKAHNNLGITLYEKRKFNEAIFHYKEALRITPNYFEAHSNLGIALFGQGRPEEAIFHFKEALRIGPDYAMAHNNLGAALAKQDKYEEAILHYKEALKLKPGFADVHNNMGSVLVKQDKHEKAMFHYKEAIRINPDLAEAHNNKGNALIRENKFEEAMFHYKEVLRINPDYAKAHHKIGAILAGEEKYEEALFHFKEALRIGPESADISNMLQSVLTSLGNAKKHYDKGLSLQLQGNLKEAIINYKEAIRIHPYDLKCYNNLSWVLATSKDPSFRNATKAVELAEKVCELTGHKAPLMLDTLAAAYAGAGRFDEASQTASKAIELAKSNGQQELAGVIEKRMQLYKSGSPFYEDVLTTSP